MNEIDLDIDSFQTFCRICMKERKNFKEIFETSTDEDIISIDQKIMACASVDLNRDDGLPTRICVQCLFGLNAAFEFRTRCENADKTLRIIRNLLLCKNSKNEKEEKVTKIEFNAKDGDELQFEQIPQNLKNKMIENKLCLIKNEEVYSNCIKLEDENLHTDSSLYLLEKTKGCNEESNEILIFGESEISEEKEKPEITNPAVKYKIEAKKSPCPYCKKLIVRVSEHIRLLHRNKAYVCKKFGCGAKFLTLKNLQSHQLKCYEMKKAFKCHHCSKEFHRKSNFKAHFKRHSGIKDFKCELCERVFVDSTGLKRHFLRHHEQSQEIFVGGCCGKKFKSKEGLKKHIKNSICGFQEENEECSDKFTTNEYFNSEI